jgi:hypothetical protein
VLVGADNGGVDLDQPVDVAGCVRTGLDLLESLGEHAGQGVAAEAGVDGLPRSIAFWQVTPGSAGPDLVDHPVDDLPVRHTRPTGGGEERGLSYVLALTGKEVAHPEDAEPYRPAYSGLGPPTLPRYRTPPRAVWVLAAEAGADRFTEVTWRQGSKGAMTSRFAVLTVRPAGKQALAAAQEADGGRNRWDGVLPVQTLLVEWPDGQDAPTDYWISNLPASTPVADLVRWAKMRWRIEHDYRELKHGLGLDHFEGRTWRGWHHHVTLVTAAQAFLTLRRLDLRAHTPA